MGRSTAQEQARAGPSRSSRASQSQTQPSQTQNRRGGGRRGQPVDPVSEEEEEDDDDDDVEDDDADQGAGEGEGAGDAMDVDGDDDGGDSDIARKANALVRLALFTEHKRAVLRREDISKKVLASTPRVFPQVFALAQKKLREILGMEMVELATRAGLDGLEKEKEKDQDPNRKKKKGETQAATGLKKKAAATTTKNYVLRSVLDPILIEHAAQTDEDVYEGEAQDQGVLFPTYVTNNERRNARNAAAGSSQGANHRSNRSRNRNRNAVPSSDDDDEGNGNVPSQNPNDEEDDEEYAQREEASRAPKNYGSILSWSKADQLGSLGVLYVILALVLSSGRVIDDAKLRTYLRTLRIPSSSSAGSHPIHLSSTSTSTALSIDDFLTQLLKQGYLHRQTVGGPEQGGKKPGKGGGGAGSKRVRSTQGGGDGGAGPEGGVQYEWRWGARAYVEVGEESMARFVAEFMVSSEDNGDADVGEEETREDRKRKRDAVDRMVKGVEKAAGGKFVEYK